MFILPPKYKQHLTPCNYGEFIDPITKRHFKADPHYAPSIIAKCIGTCKPCCGPVDHLMESLNVPNTI